MAPKTLEEIKEFCKGYKAAFYNKGVLSVQDAYKCLEAGVRGIVVFTPPWNYELCCAAADDTSRDCQGNQSPDTDIC